MSLDFKLYALCDTGGKEPRHHSVVDLNITHNLSTMADKAGIYDCLWRPDENEITRATDLISPLEAGIKKLESDPEKYKAMNPENGWGCREGLLLFAKHILESAKDNPSALISVCR